MFWPYLRRTTRDEQVPGALRKVWAEKQDVIVSPDGDRIDFHGGGKRWEPRHLSERELEIVSDTFVLSLLHVRVTSINLKRCSKLTDESIKAIAKGCPRLKVLNVAVIDNLTDESIKAIAKGCPELKELNVRYCKHLTDEAIKAIAKGCPKLQKLNIRYCKHLTDESIKTVASACHELRELNVEYIQSFTDESIKAIANGCSELRELYISSEHLTDHAIKAVAEGCPQLEKLNVAAIDNLTDDSIKAIATGCPKLKALNVSLIKNLTDEPIKAIAQGCPELTQLNVGWINLLTDESIKAIAIGCPQLNELNVRQCSNLTDDSIKDIAAGCPLLMRLDAHGCGLTSLPSDIGDRLPDLQELEISDNNLTALPRSIVKLKKLHDLNVDDNPLQSPPYEIATQDLRAIERYFEELEKGSTISKLLKIVLVGDGEAGKTSLRNALAGRRKPRQQDRTVHLDMEKITLAADLDINAYDCGGQAAYLATQLPYLTGLALYLLIVEAQYATDEYADALDDKLHRFLVVLQNRVPGAIILPIVTKVDTIEDPARRCHWLENKIERWLQDTREAVCGDSSPGPRAPPASADEMGDGANRDIQHFSPLRVQSPALAVSVADTKDVEDVRNSVRAVRDRIVALTKHHPPLLRGVGQHIPDTYSAVLQLFGALAEFGDNEVALRALRDVKAQVLGKTSKLSPDGTYRPKNELAQLWTTFSDDDLKGEGGDVFEDAIRLWEAQGLVFIDAGLVVLQPEYTSTIVKPLVDHRYDGEQAYNHRRESIARFLKASSPGNNDRFNQLNRALTIYLDSDEIEDSCESLLLSFLWHHTGLSESHYNQVLQMLATCSVILNVMKREEEHRRTVAVVPFRLAKHPDKTKLESFWPNSLTSIERELKIRFEPISGFPTGLTERFVADVHGLGTSLYSWRSGVVVKDSAGYTALAERKGKVLQFTVRFEPHSNADEDAAWKTLCRAQQLLAGQREIRFPGLFYEELLVCEECCRNGMRPEATTQFAAKTTKCVFRGCGHIFRLNLNWESGPQPGVTVNIVKSTVSGQINGSVGQDAILNS